MTFKCKKPDHVAMAMIIVMDRREVIRGDPDE